MANLDDFSTMTGLKIRTFDVSGGHAMEQVLAPDATTSNFVIYVHQVDVAACATAGFRLLDNSATLNRICALPAADNSGGLATNTWDFHKAPVKVCDFCGGGIVAESTIAGQLRGVIQYTKSVCTY